MSRTFLPPLRFLMVACLAAALPAVARAQTERRIEVEGVFGLTAVDVNTWAMSQGITYFDWQAYGVNVRGLLASIGRTRVGVEVGTHRLFRYETFSQIGFQQTYTMVTEASQHVSAFMRLETKQWAAIDAGFGFHYLKKATLPGFFLSGDLRLLSYGRMTLPIGARIDLIVDQNAAALPLTLKSGASFKL